LVFIRAKISVEGRRRGQGDGPETGGKGRGDGKPIRAAAVSKINKKQKKEERGVRTDVRGGKKEKTKKVAQREGKQGGLNIKKREANLVKKKTPKKGGRGEILLPRGRNEQEVQVMRHIA